jgi:tetratricopeptide (TPR) repeat protein
MFRFTEKVIGKLEATVKLGELTKEKTSRYALLESAANTLDDAPTIALKNYEEVVANYPEDALALNAAAWFLVTTETKELRDPKRAITWARKAVKLTAEEDGNILDTLAVALHEDGQLEEASRLEQRAAELTDDEEIAKRAKAYARELRERK